MPMGDSAGRSSGNRTAEGAHRRATQRERAAIDPPFDREEERHWGDLLTPRGQKVLNIVAWSSWLVFCVFLALLLAAWFGAI